MSSYKPSGRRASQHSDRSGHGRPGSQTGNSAKIWSIYLSHAEKYDKALVESWKGDMDGILIFSGLFSAVVSAFVVDSYKFLQEDFNAATVQALVTISAQLANPSTDVLAVSPNLVSQDPKGNGTMIAINVLWFLSLVFSLSCALGATLVQQWSRTYIQGTEERFIPHEKARMRTYLLEGVERFGVTAMVQAIPVMLHVALFLFFAGLVVFLFTVNTALAAIVLGFIVLLGLVYGGLTASPVIYDACPYRTPLSSVFWGAFHFPQSLPMNHDYKKSDMTGHRKSMSLATNPHSDDDDALYGDKRHDLKALRWTMNSIMTNNDLEIFMEAIPGFIQSEPLQKGSFMIQELLFGPDLMGKRVANLLRTCCSGSMLEVQKEKAEKRAAACLNVINLLCQVHDISQLPSSEFWTIYAIQFFHPIVRDVLILKSYKDNIVGQLAYHSSIIMTWRAICNYKIFLDAIDKQLSEILVQQKRMSQMSQCLNSVHKSQITLQSMTNGVYIQNPMNDLFKDMVKDAKTSYGQKLAKLSKTLAGFELGSQLETVAHMDISPVTYNKTESFLQDIKNHTALLKECLCVFYMYSVSLMMQELSISQENNALIYDTLTVISKPIHWKESILFNSENDLLKFFEVSLSKENISQNNAIMWNAWNVVPNQTENFVSTKIINIILPFIQDVIQTESLANQLQKLVHKDGNSMRHVSHLSISGLHKLENTDIIYVN